MENKDKRTGWIQELKVGDKVTIECGSYNVPDFSIGKIDKITPTGRIAIGNTVYDHNGRQMGASSAWSKTNNLEPLTQATVDFIRKSQLCNKFKLTNWGVISLDKLNLIYSILKEDK